MSDEYERPIDYRDNPDEELLEESAYELSSEATYPIVTPPEEAYEADEPYPWENPAPEEPSMNPLDRLLLDKSGSEAVNYTGDEESERDYRPIRQSHEYKSGCLGGLMYFVFVLCLGVVLACLAWMAASDMLALNKDDFTVTVNLDQSHFPYVDVPTYDENGAIIGTERVRKADLDYVATALKDAGLIEYKWLFTAFCKLSHADLKMTFGEYELRSSYDYRALVQHMSPNGDGPATVTVTFPEGYTMRQIFQLLDENNVSDFDELMKAAREYKFNYSFLESQDEGSENRLEGYLFPDTYEFYTGIEASSAINKFLETFYYNFDEDLQRQLASSGRDIREIVTIASMIEKEAANDEERPMIASVIYNRMSVGMPLGIDSTILYIHPGHEGPPTAEMLTEDSPYNTRDRIGLPPTPICNPGIQSLKAALAPATTNYYYYALDTATCTHRFFTNINEFNAFVATQDYGA